MGRGGLGRGREVEAVGGGGGGGGRLKPAVMHSPLGRLTSTCEPMFYPHSLGKPELGRSCWVGGWGGGGEDLALGGMSAIKFLHCMSMSMIPYTCLWEKQCLVVMGSARLVWPQLAFQSL